MANNQLPPGSRKYFTAPWLLPYTFSTAECLQWWVFIPVKRHHFAGFWTRNGGRRLPQGCLDLYGTNLLSNNLPSHGHIRESYNIVRLPGSHQDYYSLSVSAVRCGRAPVQMTCTRVRSETEHLATVILQQSWYM